MRNKESQAWHELASLLLFLQKLRIHTLIVDDENPGEFFYPGNKMSEFVNRMYSDSK